MAGRNRRARGPALQPPVTYIIIILVTFFRVSLIPSCKAGLLNTKTLFDYAVYPGRTDAQGRRQKKPSVSFYIKNHSSHIMDHCIPNKLACTHHPYGFVIDKNLNEFPISSEIIRPPNCPAKS